MSCLADKSDTQSEKDEDEVRNKMASSLPAVNDSQVCFCPKEEEGFSNISSPIQSPGKSSDWNAR
jgi:hypothetical protein